MGTGRTTIAALLAAFVCGGCYGGVGAHDGSGGDVGEDVGEDGGDDGIEDGVLSCEQGSPGPRMLRLLTRREYAATVGDLLNIEPPAIDLIPVEPTIDGYDNDAAASVVTARHIHSYMEVAELVANEAVEQSAATLVSCMPADPECARLFVESFGRRAMRRPLTGEEVDLYLELFDPEATQGDFYEGVRLVVRSFLMSPQFMYRSELGEPVGDGGLYRLTPYEIASALSYNLWGTMPDDELLEAAAAGELDEVEGIEAQARRMLEGPRGRLQVGEFFTQWLGTGPLLQVNKDAAVYPDFTPEIREAMAAEQKAFIDYVMFDSTATLQELLLAEYVFVDDTLANYYGLPAPGSGTPVPVPTGPDRGGLLMLGSVLASHAHPNESSPVARGTFVRERLLCQPLPPPPPDVDVTPPEIDPNATTRERFNQHSADPNCSGCHALIDPLGFGFESYDGVGAFRTEENGLPIDATGEVIRLSPDADAMAFDGPRELAEILANSPVTASCTIHHYVRFTNGREVTDEDECTVETLTDQLIENDWNLHDMIIDRVTLDAFVLRRE